MPQIFPLFVAGDKIIPLIAQDHLIGRCTLVALLVQFFVRAVLIVAECDLLTLFDCRVDDLDVVKQGLIVRFVPFVHRPDVFDVRAENTCWRASKAAR